MVRRWLLRSTAEPNECAILELSGVGVSSGNSYTHQRGERQKPHGGVPSRETKATTDKMKGFQHKLGFTQGIIAPSDGKSGGLVLLWREMTDIRFKSYSHFHIDVVVHSEGKGGLWGITGFYGHPDTSKRQNSWQLLDALNAQCVMSWVVCGDFNEILHPDEKTGWKERDADQIKEFREVLSKCGLFDLGFVG